MKFNSSLSFAFLTSICLGWAAAAPANASDTEHVLLKSQLGPYPVSINDYEIQTSRPDPLAPAPQLRRFMITVYRPFLDNFTCPEEFQSRIPYAPPVVITALLGTLGLNSSQSDIESLFAPLQLINCSRPASPSAPSASLLLFSPGLGGTHHVYQAALPAVASSGYTVVAIDHTYDAAAVVFPDGEVAYMNSSAIGASEASGDWTVFQDVRIADSVSVLDAIEHGDVPGFNIAIEPTSNSTTSSSPSYYSTSSHSSLRTVMFGHSFGGSTAANVALSEPRVLAAINEDGTFYGAFASNSSNATATKPLLMMGESDPAWKHVYDTEVRGWKTWVYPNNTVHYCYTDLPLLADLLDVRGAIPGLDAYIGTVNPTRLQEIVWSYTVRFFDFVLKGRRPGFLDAESAQFPDVAFFGHEEAVKAS